MLCRRARPQASIEGGCAWRSSAGELRPGAARGADSDALACFAWAAVAGVGVDDEPAGDAGRARTSEFFLPPAIAARVAAGGELGPASDEVFGTVDCKRGGGTVGALTGGALSRTEYYEQPFLLAALAHVPGTGAALYGEDCGRAAA